MSRHVEDALSSEIMDLQEQLDSLRDLLRQAQKEIHAEYCGPWHNSRLCKEILRKLEGSK